MGSDEAAAPSVWELWDHGIKGGKFDSGTNGEECGEKLLTKMNDLLDQQFATQKTELSSLVASIDSKLEVVRKLVEDSGEYYHGLTRDEIQDAAYNLRLDIARAACDCGSENQTNQLMYSIESLTNQMSTMQLSINKIANESDHENELEESISTYGHPFGNAENVHSYASSYYLVFTPNTAYWYDAVAKCEQYGPRTHIVAIESEEEQSFLANVFKETSPYSSCIRVWTGGYKRSDDTWFWKINDKVKRIEYTSWSRNEPNHDYEDKICLDRGMAYKWNNVESDFGGYRCVICEYEV